VERSEKWMLTLNRQWSVDNKNVFVKRWCHDFMGSANRCAPCSYKWKGDSEYGNIIICPAKRTGIVSGIISAFG